MEHGSGAFAVHVISDAIELDAGITYCCYVNSLMEISKRLVLDAMKSHDTKVNKQSAYYQEKAEKIMED